MSRRILPGFKLSLGFTLAYLGFLLLTPMAACLYKAAGLSGEQFLRLSVLFTLRGFVQLVEEFRDWNQRLVSVVDASGDGTMATIRDKQPGIAASLHVRGRQVDVASQLNAISIFARSICGSKSICSSASPVVLMRSRMAADSA